MIGTLSPAELKVFELLAQGYSRAEISEMLCRSPNTVTTHIARVAKKLNARSPVHAVILFVRDQVKKELGK